MMVPSNNNACFDTANLRRSLRKEVAQGSIGESCGLQKGDFIISINNQAASSTNAKLNVEKLATRPLVLKLKKAASQEEVSEQCKVMPDQPGDVPRYLSAHAYTPSGDTNNHTRLRRRTHFHMTNARACTHTNTHTHTHRTAADISKARELLGYEPKVASRGVFMCVLYCACRLYINCTLYGW